jgi:magnesium chelatase family protein
MLARRRTTILPAMTLPGAIDTTRIHSVAGLTGARTALVSRRPCRARHHTLSDVGLIGGGQVLRTGGRTMACCSWMNCRRAAAMSWKCCGSRLKMA